MYKQIIQNECDNYFIIGRSIWNQYLPQNPWYHLWKNTFCSYTWPENNNILYIFLHFATSTNDHIYKWTNQKHLKTPKCKLCEKTENINIFTLIVKEKNIWIHLQEYYKNPNTKRIHVIATHTNQISLIITTKNREISVNIDCNNTYPHPENKKSTTI